jgi:hypothetical protein
MRGLLVEVSGSVQVVASGTAEWDQAEIAALLECRRLRVRFPDPALFSGTAMRLWLDHNGKLPILGHPDGRPPNPGATALLEGRLPHRDYVVAGPVLLTGFDSDTGADRSLGLTELLRVAERLVRAERQPVAG